MMINATELLQLNDDEKLSIIDMLQSSLFNKDYVITEDQFSIVEERLEKIEKGETKLYSLAEFQKKIDQYKKS
ncbi:MAG: hypothetical protein EOO87_16115 [Pedobacter sp.]|nr:MAG: hypothetical protein EOO87_16115 [Pedobacter sp.]